MHLLTIENNTEIDGEEKTTKDFFFVSRRFDNPNQIQIVIITIEVVVVIVIRIIIIIIIIIVVVVVYLYRTSN